MTAAPDARPPEGVLIDLDGTLLDTAGDLAAAANRMLAALGRPPCPVRTVAAYVGKGVERLVERVLTGDMDAHVPSERLRPALQAFDAFYVEESGRSSRVYPGVVEGLGAFAAAGVPLACVTSKPRRHALALLERFALDAYVPVLVAGDDVRRRKPDPEPVALACATLGVAARRALMIGDSGNDVQAARAAGCTVWCVAYGYTEGRSVDALGADAVVADLREASLLALGQGIPCSA